MKIKGEGTSPEQEQLVHSLLHSGGKFLLGYFVDK